MKNLENGYFITWDYGHKEDFAAVVVVRDTPEKMMIVHSEIFRKSSELSEKENRINFNYRLDQLEYRYKNIAVTLREGVKNLIEQARVPNTDLFIAVADIKLVFNVLWPTVVEFLPEEAIFNRHRYQILFPTGSRINFLTLGRRSSDPHYDRLGGYRFDSNERGYMLDIISKDVPPKAYEALERRFRNHGPIKFMY